MTLSSTAVYQQFNGNGSATNFSVTGFQWWEVEVVHISAAGVETTWVEGSDYSLLDEDASPMTGGDGRKGTVVADVAPASGTKLRVWRITDRSQEVAFVENDAFPSSTVEDSLDRLSMQVQELETDIKRTPKISKADHVTLAGVALTLPTPDAGTLLAWNDDEDGFENIQVADIGAATFPVSSTDNAVVRFDGAGGISFQNSGVTISDANVMAGAKVMATGGTVARLLEDHFADAINVLDHGADPTGTNDSAAAIQAAIDLAALVVTARSTVRIPASALGNSYKINSALTWKPNVNIVCDPGVRIFAGAAMDAMLQTGTGSGNRLRSVWLKGGRWDGAYLAKRCFWIKDGERVWLKNFLIKAIGPYVDGTSETVSAYIDIGDAAQSATCYEIMVDDFDIYRNDDGGSPTPAPAQNYGIRSGSPGVYLGGSDAHITNGVIFGTHKGIYGQLAGFKIDRVHFWDFPPATGIMVNAIHSTDFGCSISNVQVDTTTASTPIKLGGNGVAYVLNNLFISCVDGTDNTGAAMEIGTGAIVSAFGTRIECLASHRFADDVIGDLGNFASYGGININVVSPNVNATHLSKTANSDFFEYVINNSTGASATAGYWAQTNAGNATFLARSTAAGASLGIGWDGASGMFITASHASGAITLQTGGANNRIVISSAGLVTIANNAVVGHTAAVTAIGGTPKMQVLAADLSAAVLAGRYSANSAPPRFVVAKSRNAAVGSHTIVQSGDQIGEFVGQGSDGATFLDAASITFEVDGTPNTTDMPGRIVFKTTPDGSATLAERLRIGQDGQLQFAAASFTANGAGTVTISNVKPASAATATITRWLTFKDEAGVDSYVPVWQ